MPTDYLTSSRLSRLSKEMFGTNDGTALIFEERSTMPGQVQMNGRCACKQLSIVGNRTNTSSDTISDIWIFPDIPKPYDIVPHDFSTSTTIFLFWNDQILGLFEAYSIRTVVILRPFGTFQFRTISYRHGNLIYTVCLYGYISDNKSDRANLKYRFGKFHA